MRSQQGESRLLRGVKEVGHESSQTDQEIEKRKGGACCQEAAQTDV